MSDHPDENEINEMLELAAHKINTVYEVVFEISQYDAEILVDCWDDASNGDTEAVYKLMNEMSKLIGVLQEQMEGQ
jgi:hypothetical protein